MNRQCYGRPRDISRRIGNGRDCRDEVEALRVIKAVKESDAWKAREKQECNAWRNVTLARMPWDKPRTGE